MKEIIDTFGNKIPLRTKNAEVLYEYITKRYGTESKSIAKLFHIFRVAEACIEVGRKLGLDENISYNIGLLHDYARFWQWENFRSYSDNKTCDHADKSVELLFEEGEIDKFEISEDDYALIEIAIKNHNKKEIDLQQIASCDKYDYDTLLKYCKMIRDCDKIDIIYRMSVGDITGFKFNVHGVSDKVIECIKKYTCVDKKDISTGVDEVLTIIAYLFDLNFNETLSYIDFDKLFEGIEKHYYSQMDESDRELLNKNILYIKEYILKRLSTQENC